MRQRSTIFRGLFLGTCLAAALFAAPAGAGHLELISRANPMPDQIDGIIHSSISADGRYAAFSSFDANLVPGQVDSNGGLDIFLFDRLTGTTALVSHTPGSATTAANRYSWEHALSADGKWIAFASQASDLVAGQSDGEADLDIFLYEVATGTVTLVSHAAGSASVTGNLASAIPRISADGRRVAYISKATDLIAGHTDANSLGYDVFLYDRVAGTTTLVSRRAGSATTTGNARSEAVWLSADGEVVAFLSGASDLVPGQVELSYQEDLFAYDHATGTTALVTHAMGSLVTTSNHGVNQDGLAMSSDGRYIAFGSSSTDLVPLSSATWAQGIYLYDRSTGQNRLASHAYGQPGNPVGGGAPSLSADGRWLCFVSEGVNLVEGQVDEPQTRDVFVWDRQTGTATLVSHVFGSPQTSAAESMWSENFDNNQISADGRFVLFDTALGDRVAPGLATGGTLMVVLWDRLADTVLPVSHAMASRALPANGNSRAAGLSADGGQVLFTSIATDVAGGEEDSTRSWGVFLYDRLSASAQAAARRAPTMPSLSSPGDSWWTAASSDGAVIAFGSESAGLVPEQQDYWDPWFWPGPPGTADVFVRDRTAGATGMVSHASSSPALARGGAGGLLDGGGRYVLFSSPAGDLVYGQTDSSSSEDVFLLDRVTGTAVLVSHIPSSATTAANGASSPVALSEDGRWAVFRSNATNLVAGTDLNGGSDVFLYDRLSGAVTLVSHAAGSPATTANGASEAHGLSADGRWVLFTSTATNLLAGQVDTSGTNDVFLFDRLGGPAALVSRSSGSPVAAANSPSQRPRISQDGGWVVFDCAATDLIAGLTDTNGASDLFLWERATGALTLVSHAAASPATAANGMSHDALHHQPPAISADGGAVAFVSYATDLVAGQDTNGNPDVFLYERASGAVTLVSHGSGSPTTAGSSRSVNPAISADGSAVAFQSRATDLVPGQADTNVRYDTFLWNRSSGATRLASGRFGSPETTTREGSNGTVRVSDDGLCVLFNSAADDLVFGDFNNSQDVFRFCDTSDPGADLILSVSDSADPTLPGAALTYTVGISNVGPAPASGVTATLALPPDATFLGASGAGWTCGLSGGLVVCTRPELAVGPGAPLTVQTTAPSSGMSLSATASATAATPDPVPGNSEETETTRFRQAAIHAAPASGLTTREEGAGTTHFLLLLERQPSANVTVPVSSGDLTEGTVSPPSVTFTPADWTTPRVVTVAGVEDDVRDGDTSYPVLTGAASSSDAAYAGLDAGNVTVVNVDDESIGVFYTITPCRLFDTRTQGLPLGNNGYHGVQVAGVCGIPPTVKAIAANVTITEATGSGHLTFYPIDQERPATSNMNFRAGLARANNAILVPSTDTGTLMVWPVVTDGGSVHVIVDVTGYFE